MITSAWMRLKCFSPPSLNVISKFHMSHYIKFDGKVGLALFTADRYDQNFQLKIKSERISRILQIHQLIHGIISVVQNKKDIKQIGYDAP